MRSVTDNRTAVAALLAAGVCLALVTQARGASQRQVDSAVKRGLAFLFAKQAPDGTFGTRFASTHRGGVESLVVLAALTGGQEQNPSQKNIAACLEYINRSDPQTVYARALRTMVYARLEKGKYAKRLAGDVTWLVKHQQASGGWGYGPTHAATLYRPQRSDNSNSQLAVLALHEAQRTGASVSDVTWRRCLDYWLKTQNKDGGWGYEPDSGGGIMGGSSASMTAAGSATFCLLIRKQLRLTAPYDASGKRVAAAEIDMSPMRRALKRLEDMFDVRSLDQVPGALTEPKDTWLYYYLFCLIRSADEAGVGRMKGRHWLGSVVDQILRAQRPGGGWHGGDKGDAVVRTSFAILALLRARAGALVTKIRAPYSGPDDFFDVRNFADWYEQRFGQNVCWRLANRKTDTWEMRHSPIVYITGRGDEFLPRPLADRVNWYARSGGTVVIQGTGGDAKFRAAGAAFFKRGIGEYRARPLAADHPIFSLRFRVPHEKFSGIIGIGDGCRTRVFILPGDVSGALQHGRAKDNSHALELMANIALYATDGGPVDTWLDKDRRGAAHTTRRIRIARVYHGGDWHTNPGALHRLSEVLSNAVSLGLRRETTDLRRGLWGDLKMLWLTGTTGPKLDKRQLEKLKAYLQGGGFLFADPATGGEDFFNSARAMFEKMFGPSSFTRLPADSPIITGQIAGGAGSDIRTVRYSRALAKLPGVPTGPVLWQVVVNNRIVAIVSRYGVTCPLEGKRTYGSLGLSTPDARRLAANIVLYAVSRK